MKRNRRRLPVPQWEFGFAVDTFNLIVETGVDGDRIAHERAEVDDDRRRSDAAQPVLFKRKQKSQSAKHSGDGHQWTPKRTPTELSRVKRNSIK